MPDFLRLLLPIFLFPTDYAESRKKLASLLGWETYFVTYYLSRLPEVTGVLSPLDLDIPGIEQLVEVVGVVNVPALIVAIIVLTVSYIFHLHDRISDLVGIRRHFDKKHILLPLAQLVGVDLTDEQIAKIPKKRDSLMRQVFYKFASSSDQASLVDKHDINNALDNWCWFWFFVEGTFIFLAAMMFAFFYGSADDAWLFVKLAAAMFVLGSLLYLRLPRYARPQIEAIANDPTASAEVRQVFNAL